MADHGYDELTHDLVALGRAVHPPSPATDLATAVLERVSVLPEPRRRTGLPDELWRSLTDLMVSRRRRVALVVGAALLALLATPPVRAAVADWFGFGAVRVERGSPSTGPVAPPPAVSPGGSAAEAASRVGFTVSVPAALGDPDGVEVAADLRSVAMSWTTEEAGLLRLDQFDARLDFSVLKTSPDVSYVAVDGVDALWFDRPHEVALLGPDGTRITESARLAGHTLIWQDGSVTLRLEGDVDLSRAVAIAESTVPVD